MKVGDRHEAVVVEDLHRTHVVQYAAASGDFHPVHHDETVAQAMGFPSVFAHGMLTMGLTGRLLEEVFGRGALTRYGARLVAQVWPGDTLTASLTVTAVEGDLATLAVETRNQHGTPVLTGEATARFRP